MTSILYLIAILTLPLLYLVETLSWYVKAVANNDQFGRVVARTNILLYLSRFFFFTYSGVVYFLIESGTEATRIYSLLLYAFLLSALSQTIFLNRHCSFWMASTTSRILDIQTVPTKFVSDKHSGKIFIWGSIAVALFASAIILPVVFALSYPEYRLSLSSLAQILNAFGTVVLLILVDPKLYDAMDQCELNLKLRAYSLARIIGFAFAVLLLFALRQNGD